MKPDRNSGAYKFGRFLGLAIGTVLLVCVAVIVVALTVKFIIWVF